MIDINKKYRTRDGASVRILCTDAKRNMYPVVALVESENSALESIETFTADGRFSTSQPDSPFDLFVVTPYDNFKIDEPVLVKQRESGRWYKRHFSGVNDDGMPMVFMEGLTSWTCGNTPQELFDHCIRPPKNESR